MAVRSDPTWERISKPDPALYRERLKAHAQVLIPQELELLRSDKYIVGVDSVVMFIFEACRRTVLPLEQFISHADLCKLRRTALLRSGRAPLTDPDERTGNLPEAYRSHALMAGITAEELGISDSVAEYSLKRYLGKGIPYQRNLWQAACQNRDMVNRLFPIAAH